RVFVAIRSIYKTSAGDIRAVNLAGGLQTIVSAPQSADPCALVFRDGVVYWTDRGTFDDMDSYRFNAGVKKVNSSGGALVALAFGPTFNQPGHLALTSTTVAWAGNSIQTAPLPNGV